VLAKKVSALLPRGVALIIAPWNFPMAILCGMTTAALVTAIPYHETGRAISGHRCNVMEIFEEAGVPPGVFELSPRQSSVMGAHLSITKRRSCRVHGIAEVGLRFGERRQNAEVSATQARHL